MKSLDRLQAMVAGEPVDRPPFTFYQRWPLVFMTGESLATVCYAFAEHMQLDVVVVPHAFGYPLPGTHSFDRPIDLSELPKAHGNSESWGRQIHALQRVVKANFGKRWVLQEVPSPWLLLQELAGPEMVQRTLRDYSGFLRRALETVSESLASFVRYAVETGAQGILYRNPAASFELMTPKEYAMWGEPFDARVWSSLRGSTFNVAQFVGPKPYLRELGQLPFQAVGWSVAHGPKLESSPRWEGPVFGGIDDSRMSDSLTSIRSHVAETLRDGPFTRWLLTAGEPLPYDMSLAKLEALRDAIQSFRTRVPRSESERSAASGAEPRKPRKRREEYEPPAVPLRQAPKPEPGARTRIVESKAPEETS